MLAETVSHAGSRGVGFTMNPTLPSDVSKTKSHLWQTVAEVPEEKFEEYLAKTKEAEETPTTAAVYRLAKQSEKAQRRKEKHERHEGDHHPGKTRPGKWWPSRQRRSPP